ncbi:MAG TPA: hypothetical protein VGF07_15315, partial [Stellaceae bacterium]
MGNFFALAGLDPAIHACPRRRPRRGYAGQARARRCLSVAAGLAATILAAPAAALAAATQWVGDDHSAARLV